MQGKEYFSQMNTQHELENIYHSGLQEQGVHQQKSLQKIINTDQYIDQFLYFSSESQNEHDAIQEEPFQQESRKVESSGQDISSTSKERPVNFSSFHNFQKHLVIAIRSLVKFNETNEVGHDWFDAASKLWKQFQNSNSTVKNIMYFIFAAHKVGNSQAAIKKFGFQKIYSQFSNETLQQARTFLRKMALEQLQQADLRKYLDTTRIKNKENFAIYFDEFLNQLKSGNLKRRLGRDKAQELTENMIQNQ